MAVAGGAQDGAVVRGASLLLRFSVYRERDRHSSDSCREGRV